MTTVTLADVSRCFTKSATTYEDVAWIQRDSAKALVEMVEGATSKLGGWSPQTILDIGCGTGFVSEQLIERHPESSYSLTDIAPGMLDVVKKKFSHNPKFKFIEGDAQELRFDKQDLIISNLAFQWFTDLGASIEKHLKNTDVLALTTLEQGHFNAWRQFCEKTGLPAISRPPKNYPSFDEFSNLCKSMNAQTLILKNQSVPISFDSAGDCVEYMRKLGVNLNLQGWSSDAKTMLKSMHEPIHTEYRIMYAIFVK